MINNSVMKCCVCNNEKMDEFITINDNKYHLCCIEDLKQENELLKRNCNIGNENLSFYRKENNQLKEQKKKLREWLNEEKEQYKYEREERYHYECMLRKLNELEANND